MHIGDLILKIQGLKNDMRVTQMGFRRIYNRSRDLYIIFV